MEPETILDRGIRKCQVVDLVVPQGMKVKGVVLGADFGRDEIMLSVTIPASWVTELGIGTETIGKE